MAPSVRGKSQIGFQMRFALKNDLQSCRDWTFDLGDLNHYNWCFWLVGLALALEVPDDQWSRLVALIGGEGRDILLDRVIASRQPNRAIGTMLLHSKPYARLLKAIDAPRDRQAQLLRAFVDNWYPELARKGKNELWWYIYGDPVKHPLEMGSYFGRWCIEATAAVKAFGIDDRLCLGHEHYPGDLLRPNASMTHAIRSADARPGFVARARRLLRPTPLSGASVADGMGSMGGSVPSVSECITLINRRKIAFVWAGLICIPASAFFSYANRQGLIGTPLIDVLFLGAMVILAIFTYVFAATFLSKKRAIFLSFVMAVPTIVLQVLVLLLLWTGANRAIAENKRRFGISP